jgi:drug/metabolite transporter (DMT)-like permease
LASPLVLLAYGRRVPLRGVAFTLLIFLGIVLVNVGQMEASGLGR